MGVHARVMMKTENLTRYFALSRDLPSNNVLT